MSMIAHYATCWMLCARDDHAATWGAELALGQGDGRIYQVDPTGPFENDPNLVHRGKWLREELLCQDLPDLPLNVDAMLSEASKTQSARQRIAEQIDHNAVDQFLHRLQRISPTTTAHHHGNQPQAEQSAGRER